MDVAQLSIAVSTTDVKNATREMDTMSKAGGKLEGVVKGIAAAWASWKVVQYAREAATLAARYETLGAVMGVVGNNAGYTIAQMATFEKGLTQTGISMIGARDALTMMAGAQMDLTKSSQMARIAQDAAVIGNINSSEAFQRMVQGIRSGETEILRTIGISVNFEQAYAKVSRQLGKTAKDLTDTEKLIARQNVVMEYGSKIAGAYEASMGTAGKQLLSMQRYAEDLQVVFGAIFSDAFGVVVQNLNTALADTKKWLTDNAEAANLMKENLGSAASNFVGMVKDVLSAASALADVNDEFTLMEILSGGVALSMAVLRDGVRIVLGLIKMAYGGLSTIAADAINNISKFFAHVTGFKPPAWIEKFASGSRDTFKNGMSAFTTSNTYDFFNPKPFDAKEFEREHAAKMAAAKAESAKILAGNNARLESDALAKRAQATEAATKALEAYKNQIGGMNVELTKERILLEQGTDAAYRFGLVAQRIQKQDVDALVAKKTTNDMIRMAIDLDKKLLEGRLKLLEVNPDIQKNLFGGFQRAQELGDPSRRDMEYLLRDREDLERWKDTMPLENYKKALQGITMAELKLKAEHGDIWAGMGMVVNSYTDQATESLMRMFDGGASGFRDMTASMLRDMEKLILKQMVMQPLMNGLGAGIGSLGSGGGWAGFLASFAKGWGGGKATGGNVYDGTSYLVGERGPEIFTPGRTGFITPNHALGGGTSINAPINITIQSDGQTNVQGGNGAQNMKAMAELMAAKCREVLVEESRQGGLMARA